tara:strand:+ start:383 stop:577 length:195 start_codon:yes stop_codon:yes gene_type:complete
MLGLRLAFGYFFYKFLKSDNKYTNRRRKKYYLKRLQRREYQRFMNSGFYARRRFIKIWNKRSRY